MKFQARLRECMRRGSLSVADLAKWFSRPYHTMRSWVQWGSEPRGPRHAKIMKDLLLLEALIKQRSGFPVPDDIGHYERPSYIRKIRNGRHRSLSGSRAARKRTTLRVRSTNKN